MASVFSVALLSKFELGLPCFLDKPASSLPIVKIVCTCGKCGQTSTHDDFDADLDDIARQISLMTLEPHHFDSPHGAIIDLNGVLCPHCNGHSSYNFHFHSSQILPSGPRRILDLSFKLTLFIAQRLQIQAFSYKYLGFSSYKQFLIADNKKLLQNGTYRHIHLNGDAK